MMTVHLFTRTRTRPLSRYSGDVLKLAERSGGKYYEAASVISPLIDSGADSTEWDRAWILEKKTPGETEALFYFRVSDSIQGYRTSPGL